MIFFDSDWSRYPKAVIHDTTNNISFLRTSIQLEKMGVRNNKFMLALTQPELAKYNPHKLTDPSVELRLAISYEAAINPWYFLRETVRILEQGSLDPVFYRLNRGNLSFTWLFFNFVHAFIMQPRQTGKSLGVICALAQPMFISGNKLNISHYAKDTTLIQENVDRLRMLRENLPDYMINRTSKDTDNKEGLEYFARQTKFQTYVAQPQPERAYNNARGMTTPSIWGDEVGYAINIDITYPVMMAATTAAAKSAKASGQIHSNLMSTTAPRIDSKPGKFVYNELILKSMPFNNRLYDADNREHLHEIVRTNSKNDMVSCIHSYLQLGFDHAWLQEATRKLGATQDDIDRDFLNILKAGTIDSALSPADIEILTRHKVTEPDYVEQHELYTITWYVPKEELHSPAFAQRSLIMGMDGSENVQLDFTAFTIIDTRDMSVLGTMRCNDMNIIRIGYFALYMLLRFPKMLFIPESNNIGRTVIDFLLEQLPMNKVNPFTRIYNQVVQDKGTNPTFKDVNIYDPDAIHQYRKHFGFRTTGKTRDHLYLTVLFKTLEYNKQKIRSPVLIDELATLVNRNGRIDHETGGHDDQVIAYLLGCHVMFAGKNLRYYCIDPLTVLSEMDKEVDTHKEEQLRLRAKIKELESEIGAIQDINLLRFKQMELKQLYKLVDHSISVAPIGHEQIARDMDRSSLQMQPGTTLPVGLTQEVMDALIGMM